MLVEYGPPLGSSRSTSSKLLGTVDDPYAIWIGCSGEVSSDLMMGELEKADMLLFRICVAGADIGTYSMFDAQWLLLW